MLTLLFRDRVLSVFVMLVLMFLPEARFNSSVVLSLTGKDLRYFLAVLVICCKYSHLIERRFHLLDMFGIDVIILFLCCPLLSMLGAFISQT